MELQNHYAHGQDNLLWTLAKALDILNWWQNQKLWYFRQGRNAHGVALAQIDHGGRQNMLIVLPVEVRAFHQGLSLWGRWQWDQRPCHTSKIDNNEEGDSKQASVGFVQITFFQQYGHKLNLECIYLDTCTTFSQVVLKEYLQGIHHFSKEPIACCNTGSTYTDLEQNFRDIGVCLNTMVIANILHFN